MSYLGLSTEQSFVLSSVIVMNLFIDSRLRQEEASLLQAESSTNWSEPWLSTGLSQVPSLPLGGHL